MIGIIDSGSGGLNVVLECLKYYNEDFVYLLDNANCPYGNKKIAELKEILINNINYLIKNYDVDLIIIACNTLSSLIDYSIMLNYKTPILKTVPEIKNIKNNGKNVLVFATKNTIKNSKELKYIKNNYPEIKTLHIKGLPKLIDNYLSESSIENKYKINKKLKYYFLKKYKFKPNDNLDNIKFINRFKHKTILKNKIKYKNINKNFVFYGKFVKKHLFELNKKYNVIQYISLGCTHFKHIQKFLKHMFVNKIKFFECERNVAKTSKWLIRKNKKQSDLCLVLTKPDAELEKIIYKMFNYRVAQKD